MGLQHTQIYFDCLLNVEADSPLHEMVWDCFSSVGNIVDIQHNTLARSSTSFELNVHSDMVILGSILIISNFFALQHLTYLFANRTNSPHLNLFSLSICLLLHYAS